MRSATAASAAAPPAKNTLAARPLLVLGRVKGSLGSGRGDNVREREVRRRGDPEGDERRIATRLLGEWSRNGRGQQRWQGADTRNGSVCSAGGVLPAKKSVS